MTDQRRLPSELLCLLLVRLQMLRYYLAERTATHEAYHVVHLVGDVLEPALRALHPRDHRRHLAPDDCLAREWLAERLSAEPDSR